MTVLELIADSCARNLEMLKMLLADFSDADMLVRPCAGANHALWQIGHLVGSESRMVSACGGATPPLPDGFVDKFTAKTASCDDPKAFPTKEQVLEVFGPVRAATVQWIRTLSDGQLNQPAPEQMRPIFPTVGHIMLLIPDHLAMHAGQVQVIRRKLGKAVMF